MTSLVLLADYSKASLKVWGSKVYIIDYSERRRRPQEHVCRSQRRGREHRVHRKQIAGSLHEQRPPIRPSGGVPGQL